MTNKQYGLGALVLGLMLLGGTTAYAFGPRGMSLDASALSSFTAEQQAAIQEADTIRHEAETEAQAVLEAAGVTQDVLHDAMDSYRQKQREELDAALSAGDYSAYQALVANTPYADQLTEAIFDKLVDAYQLDQAGDREGAMEIRKELADSGYRAGFGGPGGPNGPHGPRPEGE